jgi:Ca2+-binding EF-hand superfamily protein
MFDKDKSGFIEVLDLQTIMKSLGREPEEAIEMLQGLDLNQDGRIAFEEFLKIMKFLENRLVAVKDDEDPKEGSL